MRKTSVTSPQAKTKQGTAKNSKANSKGNLTSRLRNSKGSGSRGKLSSRGTAPENSREHRSSLGKSSSKQKSKLPSKAQAIASKSASNSTSLATLQVTKRVLESQSTNSQAQQLHDANHRAKFMPEAWVKVGEEYRTPVVLLTMTEEEQDRRIDNFFISILPNIPKSTWYKLFRKGEIRVNKKRIKPEYKLQAGDEIRVAPLTLTHQEDKNLALESAVKLNAVKELANRIVYEDEGMLIVNKPVGIAVHGGSGLSYGVIEALRVLLPNERKLELVHRIDRETSGLLIIAKKNSFLKHLQEQFREKTIQKSYYCLMPGKWTAKRIDAPLHRYEKNGERFVEVSDLGKPSVTNFRVQDYLEDDQGNLHSLVEAMPKTGRTHQIRVHCLYELSALAGDQKYALLPELSYYKKLGLNRMFLHAFKLNFIHPKTLEPMQIEIPLDPELQRFVDGLTKLSEN